MSRRQGLSCVVLAVVAGGCWTDDGVVNGFEADQWQRLQAAYHLSLPASCSTSRCMLMAQLGQQLFFDTELSKLTDLSDPTNPDPTKNHPGTESCASCHDPKNWFTDTREPNNVSLNPIGGWTKRNAMTLVDSTLKEPLSPASANVFTWGNAPPVGPFPTAGSVLSVAITGAMKGSVHDVAQTIQAKYAMTYDALFSSGQSDEAIFTNLEDVFEAYLRRLTSANAPFDRWLAGDDTAISESAKRGFRVFVGPAGCAECHSGPLFTNLQAHATGVPPGAVTDDGFGDGTYTTPLLRQIAKTGPYMHDGVFATLGEVIDFYRRGGDTTVLKNGQPVAKDPRIVPLDITNDDALDLEAFLDTLTGDAVPDALTKCPEPVPCMQ